MQKRYIETGEIVTTHGVFGEIKIYPWADSPQVFSKIKKCYLDADGKKEYTIKDFKLLKNMVGLKLENIDTLEDARALVGSVVYLDRNDIKLPKGRYFVQDLIGLQVKDFNTGEIYGEIIDITKPAKNDIYTIKTTAGKQVLFPAVSEFIEDIDIEQNLVLIKPIEGMFTDCE